ncbi:hypothetical protein [Clostridium estertheticum]|uniref:hypothetical protein n=1 Tax=Clostridium estertheticum TaxID=238834 RepID=UPI001CF1B708|nr:hypothetical protein [Clostridium estertheticum]MCB2352766.1 hypothetical protein [Clostridium estertheticum]WAG40074.1 hypothetical protein LL065_17630 [Clostridium estertheticum]
MFISPPNNFNQSPMWNTDSSSLEPPMTPMPKFGMNDDSRQGPMPGASTTSQTPTTTQDFDLGPTSPIVNNPLYNQGWLQGQIGKYVRVDFLLGTNTFQDRQGLLQEVGISFIVLKESNTNNLIMCDIYSIKFVTVFGNQNQILR